MKKWPEKCKMISNYLAIGLMAIGLIGSTSFYARDFIFGSETNASSTCGMSDKLYSKDGVLKYRYVKPDIKWADRPTFGKNLIGKEYDIMFTQVSKPNLIIFMAQLPISVSPHQPWTWISFNEMFRISPKNVVQELSVFNLVMEDSNEPTVPKRVNFSFARNLTHNNLRTAIQYGSCSDEQICENMFFRLTLSGSDDIQLNKHHFHFIQKIDNKSTVAVFNNTQFECLDKKLYKECCQYCIKTTNFPMCQGCKQIENRIFTEEEVCQ